jgi:hypothetical protein
MPTRNHASHSSSHREGLTKRTSHSSCFMITSDLEMRLRRAGEYLREHGYTTPASVVAASNVQLRAVPYVSNYATLKKVRYACNTRDAWALAILFPPAAAPSPSTREEVPAMVPDDVLDLSASESVDEPAAVAVLDLTDDEPVATKACSKCGDVKPLTEFYVDKAKPDGRRRECSVCTRSGHRAARPNGRATLPAAEPAAPESTPEPPLTGANASPVAGGPQLIDDVVAAAHLVVEADRALVGLRARLDDLQRAHHAAVLALQAEIDEAVSARADAVALLSGVRA